VRYNYCFLVVLVFILGQVRYACAQRVYAAFQTSFPATRVGSTEVKDQDKPVTFPDLTDCSKIEVKDISGSAYQILSFPALVPKKTPVKLLLKVKKGLNVLNAITIQAVSGSAAVSPGYQINSLASLLTEDQAKEIILNPDQDFDGVQILARSLVADIEIETFYAFYLAPPQVAAEPVTVCQGDPAELSVTNVQAGYTYKWYTTATGGSPFVSSTTGTCITPPVSSATKFYVEAVESTGVVSARVPVDVLVVPKPVLAAIPDQYLCSGQSLDLATLNPIDLNGSSSGTYQWSLIAGGPPLKFTTISPSSGTSTYWVRYTHNSCMEYQSVSVKTSSPPLPITVSISNN